MDVLQRIQNRAGIIVASSPYDALDATMIQNLGFSSISNLGRKEKATLTYKSLNSLAADYIRELFATCSDARGRFLR